MDLRAILGALSISSKGLTRYQRVANFLRLLNGYSPLPLNIDLMLTARCNLACDICINRQEEQAAVLSVCREPELSPVEWMDIVRDIDKSFFLKPNLNLVGGEPSVYEGYLDIAAFAKQRGFRFSYTTNGTFLARDAEEIVSTGVDVVLVSLDGPREIHDAVRGAGVYDSAVEGIRAINELKRVRRKRAPRIFLSCVMNGYNCAHFAHLIDIAEGLGVDYVAFLHFRFPDSEMGRHDIDVDCIADQIAEARSKAAENDISVSFCPRLRSDQIAPYYLQPGNQLGRGCISPWLRMIVAPNGEVVPCRGHVVGDLRMDGTTVKRVWNNAEFRAFRRELARKGQLPSCGRCSRKQY
jgi:MoaA/NifB/PqqE/SkfB family radical SAM enzyme